MFLKLYFRLFFFVCIDGVFDNENENYPAGIEIVVKDKNLRYLTMMYKFLSRWYQGIAGANVREYFK